jgi:hypothetical protein
MPWWSLSVPIYAYAQNDYQYDDLHAAYCLGKYSSYDPTTDTYLAFGEGVRRCRSPYSVDASTDTRTAILKHIPENGKRANDFDGQLRQQLRTNTTTRAWE